MLLSKQISVPILGWHITVQKFQDFTVIQILCEINFGESRTSKTAVFSNSRTLNFDDLIKISLQKVQKYMKFKIQSL